MFTQVSHMDLKDSANHIDMQQQEPSIYLAR